MFVKKPTICALLNNLFGFRHTPNSYTKTEIASPFKKRKNIIQSTILSIMDYCDIMYVHDAVTRSDCSVSDCLIL